MSTAALSEVVPFGYELDEEHAMLRDAVRKFAREVVMPGAAARDVKGEFPADVVPQVGEMGCQDICIPARPCEIGEVSSEAQRILIARDEFRQRSA